MSYYRRSYHYNDNGYLSLLVSVIMIALILLIPFIVNEISEPAWNDGICAECNTRFQLTGASNALNRFTCPDCGKEVTRYYWF